MNRNLCSLFSESRDLSSCWSCLHGSPRTVIRVSRVLTIALMLPAIAAFGQNAPKSDFFLRGNQRVNAHSNVIAAWYNVGSKIYQGTPAEIALQFLTDNRESLGIADLNEVNQLNSRSSPAANHVMYQQVYHGIPVFESETIVSIDHQNRVSFVVNGHRRAIRVSSASPRITQPVAISILKNHLHVDESSINGRPTADLFIFRDSLDLDHLAWRISFVSGKPYGDWEALIDATSGEVLTYHDISLHYGDGTGRVFKPDPITATQNVALTDSNDQDYDGLIPAYATVTLKELNGPNSSGLYVLQGHYARSEEIEPDQSDGSYTEPPVIIGSTNFIYGRSQPGFEEVNAYYYIDAERRYIGNLPAYGGLSNFAPQWRDVSGNFSDAIRFDAHGTWGSPSSDYKHQTNGSYMTFSNYAVDDAEDLDVVLHEYGHAIQDALMGNVQISPLTEEGEIGEGVGDYLAASFRRTLSPFQPNKVAPWNDNNCVVR